MIVRAAQSLNILFRKSSGTICPLSYDTFLVYYVTSEV